MSEVQPASVPVPTREPVIAGALVLLRERLVMMGAYDSTRPPDPSNEEALATEVLARLEAVGIGSITVARLRASDDPAVWRAGLLRLLDQVESSPAPDGEWPVLSDLLGAELLADLVGVSRASLQRYRSGERTTPDDVAARLHLVAMVCADLAGSYTDVGVRRWFDRPRQPLDGRSPRQVLTGQWAPEDDDPQQVRALAAALVGFATG